MSTTTMITLPTTLIPLPTWALSHGITASRATQLARSGELVGAVRLGRIWAIPADAPKPPNRRAGRRPKPAPDTPAS